MIKALWHLHRPHLGWLLLGLLLGLITVLANIGLLALSGWFITSMALAGVAGVSMNYFTPAAIIRGLSLVRTGGRYGERLVTHEATLRVIEKLRVDFYHQIEPLAPAVLSRYRGGDLLSRLQKDVDRLDAFYLQIALPILIAALSILLLISFMALHNTLLALSTLVFLLIGAVLLPSLSLWASREAGKAQVATLASLRTEVVEQLQGQAELLAFGAADDRRARALQQQHSLQAAQQQLNKAQRMGMVGQPLLAQCAMWSVLLLGIPLLRAAELPPANLAMLALFTLASFEAIAPVPNALSLLSETRAAAHRVFGLMQAKPQVSEPDQPRALPAHGDLTLENISLHYNDNATAALQDINLTLPAGSHTLLIGGSGAGKSSLINVLLRFWPATHGELRYAGELADHFSLNDWRSRFALVSQHSELLNGSLRDNLLIANPQADEEQLRQACTQAQLGAFIDSLPEGLDTWLGEAGARLSGGQLRRLAVARALLKSAPILLLDEPTEGLDTQTEAELLASLQTLMHERTVLWISHRPVNGIVFDQTITLAQGQQVQPTTSAQH